MKSDEAKAMQNVANAIKSSNDTLDKINTELKNLNRHAKSLANALKVEVEVESANGPPSHAPAEEIAAYDEGRIAYRDDLPAADNPYEEDTGECVWWHRGWVEEKQGM